MDIKYFEIKELILKDYDSASSFKKYKKIIEEKKETLTINNLKVIFLTSGDLCSDLSELKDKNDKPFWKVSEEKDKKQEDILPTPVLWVGQEDIFTENSFAYKKLEIDKRILFLDSSIWHYYINIPFNIEKFKEKVKSVFERINKNLCKFQNLSETNVSKEFYEFQTRIFKNSYLADFGSHSTDVTPFKFHSETKMIDAASRINKNIPKDIKWRILLVDDYADKPLKVTKDFRSKLTKEINEHITIDNKMLDKLFELPKSKLKSLKESNNKEIIKEICNNKELETFLNNNLENIGKVISLLPPTKKEIIEKVLSNEEGKKYDWIVIETCKDIQSFIQLYTSKKDDSKIHDIILLDYLLGDVSVGKDERNGREYSTDILKWIKEDKDFLKYTNNKLNKHLQGPLGKFWFFPISVFSFAFMEDIRQMGYTYYDDDWVIARGADPVNTPELFRYSLFKLMEAQLNEVLKTTNILYNESISDNNDNLLMSFIDKNFAEIKCDKIQDKAKEIYPSFLDLLSSYRILKQDNHNGSWFAKSFLNKYKDLSFLISHFQHLLYMIAYLPSHNWAQMWDEFIIINQYFIDEQLELKGLKNIEDYIIQLQKELS